MIAKPANPLRWLCLTLVLPLLAACGGAEAPEKGPVVLAASSLQEALQEAADAWEAEGHPAPVLSFAATSALARQVEQGAPADLFFSADVEWMDTLEQQSLLRKGTRADVLSNKLALVWWGVPVAPRMPLEGVEDFRRELSTGQLALADPAAVPAGKYARASLEHLGLWDDVADRIVPTENVRAALALVERAEVEHGIVYATDARQTRSGTLVGFLPADSHPPIRYPLAIIASSTHPDAAAFRDFLSSDEARAIFEKHGFGTLP